MHFLNFRRSLLAAALLFVGGASLAQAPAAGALQIGDTLPALQLSDQHDQPYRAEEAPRLLIFTASRRGGDIVHEVFANDGAAMLNQRRAVIVADIHRMPGLITRLIALPRMRDYSYPVLLIRDETTGASFPQKPEQVTVLRLDGGKISAIDYAADIATLRRLVGE